MFLYEPLCDKPISATVNGEHDRCLNNNDNENDDNDDENVGNDSSKIHFLIVQLPKSVKRQSSECNNGEWNEKKIK